MIFECRLKSEFSTVTLLSSWGTGLWVLPQRLRNKMKNLSSSREICKRDLDWKCTNKPDFEDHKYCITKYWSRNGETTPKRGNDLDDYWHDDKFWLKWQRWKTNSREPSIWRYIFLFIFSKQGMCLISKLQERRCKTFRPTP